MTARAMSEREQFMKTWNRRARLEKQPHLAPALEIPSKTNVSYSDFYHEDLLEDLDRCCEITRNLGLELLVNNLTRPDVGMSVVKVIVPGLRHFRARFAPGRLYDVPVQQGWASQPLTESELNPIAWWI